MVVCDHERDGRRVFGDKVTAWPEGRAACDACEACAAEVMRKCRLTSCGKWTPPPLIEKVGCEGVQELLFNCWPVTAS